jgi:hypothetical protein
MKTKDFIKMLQEADPEGEGYIRFPDGGAPWFAESKPGYWDGPHQYLKKIDPDGSNNISNMKIVTSTKGYKIDLHVYSVDEMVWEEDGDMDEIRKRIEIDYGYLSDDRENRFWKWVEEEAKHTREYDKKFLEEWYEEVVDLFYNSGWEIRQPLDKPIGHYNCMKAYKIGCQPTTLNQGQCDILIRSGKFYPEKKEKYYVWHHDPEKGKVWKIK